MNDPENKIDPESDDLIDLDLTPEKASEIKPPWLRDSDEPVPDEPPPDNPYETPFWTEFENPTPADPSVPRLAPRMDFEDLPSSRSGGWIREASGDSSFVESSSSGPKGPRRLLKTDMWSSKYESLRYDFELRRKWAWIAPVVLLLVCWLHEPEAFANFPRDGWRPYGGIWLWGVIFPIAYFFFIRFGFWQDNYDPDWYANSRLIGLILLALMPLVILLLLAMR